MIRSASIHFLKSGKRWIKEEDFPQILAFAKQTGIIKSELCRRPAEELIQEIWNQVFLGSTKKKDPAELLDGRKIQILPGSDLQKETVVPGSDRKIQEKEHKDGEQAETGTQDHPMASSEGETGQSRQESAFRENREKPFEQEPIQWIPIGFSETESENGSSQTELNASVAIAPQKTQNLESASSKKSGFWGTAAKIGVASVGALAAFAGAYLLWISSQPGGEQSKDPSNVNNMEQNSTIFKPIGEVCNVTEAQPLSASKVCGLTEQSFPPFVSYPSVDVPGLTNYFFEKAHSPLSILENESKDDNIPGSFFEQNNDFGDEVLRGKVPISVEPFNKMTYVGRAVVGVMTLLGCGLGFGHLLSREKKAKPLPSAPPKLNAPTWKEALRANNQIKNERKKLFKREHPDKTSSASTASQVFPLGEIQKKKADPVSHAVTWKEALRINNQIKNEREITFKRELTASQVLPFGEIRSSPIKKKSFKEMDKEEAIEFVRHLLIENRSKALKFVKGLIRKNESQELMEEIFEVFLLYPGDAKLIALDCIGKNEYDAFVDTVFPSLLNQAPEEALDFILKYIRKKSKSPKYIKGIYNAFFKKKQDQYGKKLIKEIMRFYPISAKKLAGFCNVNIAKDQWILKCLNIKNMKFKSYKIYNEIDEKQVSKETRIKKIKKVNEIRIEKKEVKIKKGNSRRVDLVNHSKNLKKLLNEDLFKALQYAITCSSLRGSLSRKIAAEAFDLFLEIDPQYACLFANACLKVDTEEAKEVVAKAFDLLLERSELQAYHFALECLKYDTPESQEIIRQAIDKFLLKDQVFFACEFAKACIFGENSASQEAAQTAFEQILKKEPCFAGVFAKACFEKGDEGSLKMYRKAVEAANIVAQDLALELREEEIGNTLPLVKFKNLLMGDPWKATHFAIECLSKNDEESRFVVEGAFKELLDVDPLRAYLFAEACLKSDHDRAKHLVSRAFEIFLWKGAPVQAYHFVLAALKVDTDESRGVVKNAMGQFISRGHIYFAAAFAKECLAGKNKECASVLENAYKMLLEKEPLFAFEFVKVCLERGNKNGLKSCPEFQELLEGDEVLLERAFINLIDKKPELACQYALSRLDQEPKLIYQYALSQYKKWDEVSMDHFEDIWETILNDYEDRLYEFTEFLLKNGKEGIRETIDDEFRAQFSFLIKNNFEKAWLFLNEYFKHEKELSFDFAKCIFLELLEGHHEVDPIGFLDSCDEQSSPKIDELVRDTLDELQKRDENRAANLIESYSQEVGIEHRYVSKFYSSDLEFKGVIEKCFNSVTQKELPTNEIVKFLLSEQIENDSKEKVIAEVGKFFSSGEISLIFVFIKACLGRDNPVCEYISENAYQTLLEMNEPKLAFEFAKTCLEREDSDCLDLFKEAFELTLKTQFDNIEEELQNNLKGNRNLIFELLSAIPEEKQTLVEEAMSVLEEALIDDPVEMLQIIDHNFVTMDKRCRSLLLEAFKNILEDFDQNEDFIKECAFQTSVPIKQLVDEALKILVDEALKMLDESKIDVEGVSATTNADSDNVQTINSDSDEFQAANDDSDEVQTIVRYSGN